MATATTASPSPAPVPAYSGPSVPTMVADHSLAREIMARHRGPGGPDEAILDDTNILQLRRFVHDPRGERAAWRAAMGLADDADDDTARAVAGNGQHTLVAYAAVMHGTAHAALTDDEMAALRAWFARGGGRTDDEEEAAADQKIAKAAQ